MDLDYNHKPIITTQIPKLCQYINFGKLYINGLTNESESHYGTST